MKTSSSARISGRHYLSGQAVELEITAGKIVGICEIGPTASDLPWIAPGFVDIQSNGYGGQEFASLDLTVEAVSEITAQQATFGVTQFCPTVTTASFDTIVHALRTIDAACRHSSHVDHTVAGIHVEGPYISSADGARGAHPLEHCRTPDWEEFQEFQKAAAGRIRIVTLSAEYPQAADFIRRATQAGVVVAIGHTVASSAQIRAAVDAGARLSTHLGNGAERSLRRHPNYLWDQLAEDRLNASLIVDGHHLPPEVVQSVVRAKTPQRCLLVSDLSGLAGLPPGRYATQLCDLEILSDGRLVIAGQDQLLAGASLPIGAGVANVMRFAGVDLRTAIEMASHAPCRLLSRSPIHLRVGAVADLALFHLVQGRESGVSSLSVASTVSAGRVVYPAA